MAAPPGCSVCLYPPLCFLDPTSGSRRQAGRLQVCVSVCMCETAHILGQEMVGNWSPLRLLDPGGKGSGEGFGTKWKFLAAFFY